MVELTDDEKRKEELAAEAATRIKTGQHWTDWMMVGDGLMVGRHIAMHSAGTNAPKGKGYAKAFSAWMATRSWAFELDNPTRHDLFWCVDHRSEIEVWRDTLAQNERTRINHPSAMKRRFEATHRMKDDVDAAPKRETRYQKLEREFEQVATERDQLKKKFASGDGSLFDLKRDSAADIAKTIAANVTFNKLKTIQQELAKAIAAAKQQQAHAG
jgi:hypothetical protein